jgi:hypothetical protein
VRCRFVRTSATVNDEAVASDALLLLWRYLLAARGTGPDVHVRTGRIGDAHSADTDTRVGQQGHAAERRVDRVFVRWRGFVYAARTWPPYCTCATTFAACTCLTSAVALL